MTKIQFLSPILATLLLLIGFFMWGCRVQPPRPLKDALTSWALYNDPQGRFEFSYPADWLRRTATTEVQFFDSIDDGTSSIKVVLFEETRSWEEIQMLTEEDESTQTEEVFEETEINGIPVLIRQARNAWGESETVYYQLDGAMVALVAMYFDDKEEIRDQVHTMQTSFRAITL